MDYPGKIEKEREIWRISEAGEKTGENRKSTDSPKDWSECIVSC